MVVSGQNADVARKDVLTPIENLKFRRRSSKLEATEFQTSLTATAATSDFHLTFLRTTSSRILTLAGSSNAPCSLSGGDVVTVDGKVSARVNETLGGAFGVAVRRTRQHQ